jgi:hypothetical protein
MWGAIPSFGVLISGDDAISDLAPEKLSLRETVLHLPALAKSKTVDMPSHSPGVARLWGIELSNRHSADHDGEHSNFMLNSAGLIRAAAKEPQVRATSGVHCAFEGGYGFKLDLVAGPVIVAVRLVWMGLDSCYLRTSI